MRPRSPESRWNRIGDEAHARRVLEQAEFGRAGEGPANNDNTKIFRLGEKLWDWVVVGAYPPLFCTM